jgi:hypothetical protein
MCPLPRLRRLCETARAEHPKLFADVPEGHWGLANARISEVPILSRDREGAVIQAYAKQHTSRLL